MFLLSCPELVTCAHALSALVPDSQVCDSIFTHLRGDDENEILHGVGHLWA